MRIGLRNLSCTKIQSFGGVKSNRLVPFSVLVRMACAFWPPEGMSRNTLGWKFHRLSGDFVNRETLDIVLAYSEHIARCQHTLNRNIDSNDGQ